MRSYTNKELKNLLQLTKFKRLVFCQGDARVEIASKTLREFVQAGSGTDTVYTLSIIGEPHTYQYPKLVEEYSPIRRYYKWTPATIEADQGIRIEYLSSGLQGYAVFKAGACIDYKTGLETLYAVQAIGAMLEAGDLNSTDTKHLVHVLKPVVRNLREQGVLN